MSSTKTHAKLFLLSGALCSGIAFAIVFLLDTPAVQKAISDYRHKQIAAVAQGTPLSLPVQGDAQALTAHDFAALSVLSGQDLLRVVGHIPTDREIIADLDLMRISVLEGPAVIAEYPILSVGRPGTFWETPAGDYSVKTKERKHLSSIGGTWMPWSMQFYGNFFIHGWPTYKDGSDVPKGYSGGCIRLATDDAEKLYSLATMGTHVHVRGGKAKQETNDSSFYMRDVGNLPLVKATAFSVFDVESGKVLWSKGLDTPVAPGKLTALMSALVSVETIDQYKYVNFEALVAGGNPGKASASDPSAVQVGALLYPLLFDGSDIAAKALVELRGKKVFRNYMNEKSAAIGMANTEWGGGTSASVSTTTPGDLSRMLSYIDKQKSFIIRTTMSEERAFEVNGKTRFNWKNKNTWLSDGTFQGGLMARGIGDEGSAVAIYSLPVSEFGTRKIGFVVMGANDIENELALLRDYAGAHFFYGTEATAAESYAKVTDLEAKALQLKQIKEQLIN